MTIANTVAEAITRSRQYDEIVAVIVADIDAAIREADGIASDANEGTDWAEEAARESGAAVVSMWGWTEENEDQQSWRIEIVARVDGGAA